MGKVFAKLHIGRIRNLGRDKDLSTQQNGCDDTSVSREATSEATTSCSCIDIDQDGENALNRAAFQERQMYRHPKVVYNAIEDSSPVASSRECDKCSKGLENSGKLLRSSCQQVNPDVKSLRMLETEDVQRDAHQPSNSHESPCTSNESLSSKGDNGSNLMVDCEIHWEDIQLHEEIGQGKYQGT